MVEIAPLRGLIYNSKKIGDLSRVVSPPYDVVTEERREDLISFSRINIVNLILPQGSGDQKYVSAARTLGAWTSDGILVHDDSVCLYGLEIIFNAGGSEKRLSGFIGLLKIEEYSSGNVLRHEKTLSGPKMDRYRLLEECRVNFGLIYTIYRPDGNIRRTLEDYQKKQPFISIRPCYNRDFRFSVWRISGQRDIELIRSAMIDRSILIADGHHRYETSLIYRNKHSKGPDCRPEDYVLTLFMDSGQDELKIYPTHRQLSFKRGIDIEGITKVLSNKYDIKPLNIKSSSGAEELLQDFKTSNIKGYIFYSGQGFHRIIPRPGSPVLDTGKPDVFLLHEDILRSLDREYKLKTISFDHKGQHIKDNIDKGKYDLGVFLNPPTINDMERICYSGGLMPQKSTYFWPKPATGLVMYRL